MNATWQHYIKLFLLFFGLSLLFSLNSVGDNLFQTSAGNLPVYQDEVKNLTTFDKIWGYFVSILGPGVALLAILLARPLIKKKLIESHITQRIEQINQSNSKVRLYCQKLVSNYTPLIYKAQKLNHQDIKNLSTTLEEGYLISQESSTEVATLMYYLKNTIEQFERKFVFYNKTFAIFTDDILAFVVNSLQRIITYSTQAVPVPDTVKVKNVDVIIEPLKQFVTHGKISKFKNFRLGVNYDVDSASCLIFTDMVNNTNKPYLMESAYVVTEAKRSIAKLLYLRNIYAPLIWEKNSDEISFVKRTFNLVGFEENNTTNIDSGVSFESVDLYYANLKNITYKQKLTEESFLNDFKDSWLKNDDYKFSKPLKFVYITDEMIKVEIEKKVLQDAFNSHKGKIKKNLKIKGKKASILNRLRSCIGLN
jgi:hypothetical protein